MELILAGILLCVILWWIADGILKVTGWTDPQERKTAKGLLFLNMFFKK